MSGVRRVFAGVHGSLGSLQALRFAANEARDRDARLVPVIAWVPPGGDLAERRQPNLQLRKLWRDAAQERLWDAFDRGLGGLPADLSIEALVVRGPAGPVLVDCAKDPDDLLVVGTGRRGPAAGVPPFGQPLLPRARPLPGDRRPAVGADGRNEPRPAPLAAQAALPGPRPPRGLAPLTRRAALTVPGRGSVGLRTDASARRRSRAAMRSRSCPSRLTGRKNLASA